MSSTRSWLCSAALAAAACPVGCGGDAEATSEVFDLPADPDRYEPLPTYGPMDIPADNPMTPAKAKLGWQLFFDQRLSGDGQRSCYGCHLNEKGLSDGRATALGAFDKVLTRNSPTLWNIGFHSSYYWDGRSPTLEKQAIAAWKGGNMGAAEVEKVLDVIRGIEGYARQFEEVFGGPATEDNVGKALACYMRTIISRETPFDRWQGGDESAVSEAAKRGHEAFKKALCTNCHSGALLTDQLFHNVGIGMDKAEPDPGYGKVSGEDKDFGAFKTPTLRDVVDSAPYFHDGSVATLEEAVRLMLDGGIDNPHLDRTNLKKAELTEAEQQDLIEFLKALDEPTELEHPELPS